jgi:hypothetical protein
MDFKANAPKSYGIMPQLVEPNGQIMTSRHLLWVYACIVLYKQQNGTT